MSGYAGDPGHKFVDEGNHSAQAGATFYMQRPYSGLCVCVPFWIMNAGGHSQLHTVAILHVKFQAGACSTIGILRATKLLPMVGRSQGRLTLYLQGQLSEVSKRLESNQRQPLRWQDQLASSFP